MKYKNVFVLLLIVLLAACSNMQASTTVPLLIVSATSIPTKTVPSLTPTLFSTSKPKPTSSPTVIIPPATQTAISLIEQNWQACDGAEQPLPFQDGRNTLSPNREWMAIVCNPRDDINIYTRVFRIDGTKEWKVSYNDNYLKPKNIEIPEGMNLVAPMNAFHWSKDNNFLYLSPNIRYMDGPGLAFSDGIGLFRIDLKTGSVSITLQPGINAYKFSPNDKYLSYVVPNGIEILNLATGDVVSVPVEEPTADMGMFSWSPDSKKLVFVVAYGDWWDESQGGFSKILYDLTNASLKNLLSKDLLKCRVAEWISNTEVILKNPEPFLCNHKFDISTMEMTPLESPTP